MVMWKHFSSGAFRAVCIFLLKLHSMVFEVIYNVAWVETARCFHLLYHYRMDSLSLHSSSSNSTIGKLCESSRKLYSFLLLFFFSLFRFITIVSVEIAVDNQNLCEIVIRTHSKINVNVKIANWMKRKSKHMHTLTLPGQNEVYILLSSEWNEAANGLFECTNTLFSIMNIIILNSFSFFICILLLPLHSIHDTNICIGIRLTYLK